MIRQIAVIAAAFAFVLAVCSTSFAQSSPFAVHAAPPVTAHQVLPGLDPTTIDTSVKPCDDFYDYANGLWTKRNSIPPDRSEWSINTEAEKRNEITLKQILVADGKMMASPATTPDQKVGAFYRSGMNTAQIDAQGVKPLAPEFARIARVHDVPTLQDEIARLHRLGANVGFAFYVGADAKNSKQQIPQLYQGGLGMPDRDYYFKNDPDTKRVRAAYIAHVQKVFELMGDVPAKAANEKSVAMAIETRLAKASMTQVQQEDPVAIYHKMPLNQLDQLTPGMSWARYFRHIGIQNTAQYEINIGQPKFITEFGYMARQVPMTDWRTYMRWQLIAAASPYLSSKFETEDFAFNRTVLFGAKKPRPRWNRVEQVIDGEIGEALGQAYVERTFSPEAKEKAKQIIVNVKSALRSQLASLTWMSEATREHAVAKCDKILINAGYPDKWRDYSKLKIDDKCYVLNVFRANEFEFDRDLKKLGKPVDRTEWMMTPPTLNDYYDPSTNTVNFPAASLQSPFFDPSFDDAVNYGSLGATVGHELTHGFDNSGRKFDGNGNLLNWWTPDDEKNFDAKAATIVKQYSAFVPIGTTHINGQQTLPENIADIGGLKVAYIALEKSLVGKPRTLIDGYTPEQRFFIAYAQSWRGMERPEVLEEQLATDSHSPNFYRVNGPVADLPEFYEAFGCPVPDSSKNAGVW